MEGYKKMSTNKIIKSRPIIIGLALALFKQACVNCNYNKKNVKGTVINTASLKNIGKSAL